MEDDDTTSVAALRAHVPALGELLVDTQKPLAERFRALFTLRNIGGDEAVVAIAKGFGDASALLKHECAYCLGQMQNALAIPLLSAVLRDPAQDTMVRHEAGEALGAIGNPEALPVLMEFCDCDITEVAETCQIAVDLLRWHQTNTSNVRNTSGPYLSVDPAPPAEEKGIDALRELYLDPERSLFHRYRALFALRNIGTETAVKAIVEGLEDSSALFRHEVAYVLGQIQHPAASEGLEKHLVNKGENYMVRHECAEALGSIATEECLPILQQYAKDTEQVVKESCEVALDMHEYETSGAFQYANGISQLCES